MSGNGTYGACCACHRRIGRRSAVKALAYPWVCHACWRKGIR